MMMRPLRYGRNRTLNRYGRDVIFSLCALFLLPLALQAQITIQGQVKSKSGEPIPDVNVYLSGTYDGTTTDNNGNYRFTTGLTGSHELTFSFIGYEPVVVKLELIPGRTPLKQNATLKQVDLQLGDVEVVDSNRDWRINFERFREQFIGRGSFANETHIMNPYQINFENADQPGYLLASAPEPIEVVNNALGYRLYIELTDYKWVKSGSRGYYVIYPRFEEMEPANSREQRKWEENRKEAYLGSSLHFFRSLYDEKLASNGFRYQRSWFLVRLLEHETRFKLLERDVHISPEMLDRVRGFKLEGGIVVEYGNNPQVLAAKFGADPSNISTSHLLPTQADLTFYVDEMGNLLNPRSVEFSGEMATHRVAHLLPLNYAN